MKQKAKSQSLKLNMRDVPTVDDNDALLEGVLNMKRRHKPSMEAQRVHRKILQSTCREKRDKIPA